MFRAYLFNQLSSVGYTYPSEYDNAALTMGLDFSVLDATSDVVWATVSEMIQGNLGSEEENGRYYISHWIDESGFANTYAALINDQAYGVDYQISDTVGAVVWESTIDVLNNDLFAEENLGRLYAVAWVDESGNADNYEGTLAYTIYGIDFQVDDSIV